MSDSPEPNDSGDHEGGSAADGPDFDRLYRDHVDDARRLATILVGTELAEELVAESFARVLAQMRAGRGPATDFRSYLHVTIRNGFRDHRRRTREAPVSDQPWLFEADQSEPEEALTDFDANAAATAFATLPASWQQVLWHLEIEGRKPSEVAGILGIRPRAVSSLAHRAREGLRRAYLDAHLVSEPIGADCTWTRRRLSQYVRRDLSERADAKVTAHLEYCSSCQAAYLEVEQANEKLAGYLFPLVLVGAFPASGISAGWLAPLWSGAGFGSAGASPSSATTAAGGFSTNLLVGIVAAATVAAVAGGLVWTLTADNDRADIVAVPSPADPTSRPTPTESTPVEKPDADPPRLELPQVEPIRVVPVPAPANPATPPVVQEPNPEVPPRSPPKPPVEPGPVAVRPVAPTATPVAGCDTDGSLGLPTTNGLRYDLVTGDGRTGPWKVRATARGGHVIERGAPAEFSGDLGQRVSCTRLAAASSTRVGDPPLTQWQIDVVPDVIGGPNRTISAVIHFDRAVIILPGAVSGAGWTCRTSDGIQVGDLIEFAFDLEDLTITCQYDYSGTPPPSLGLRVTSLDLTPDPPTPATSVTLRSGAEDVETIALRH